MNTRRILTFVFSLLVVLCITLGLSACDKIFPSLPPEKCEHQWQDANCTDAKTCTICGETEGNPLGHTIVKQDAIAPTCTEDGISEGSYCSVCDEVLAKQEIIPAKGHTYGEWYSVTDATCDDAGLERRDCSCGHHETREVSEKGHDYEVVVTAPTCTEQGYTTYTCACGDTYVDNYVPATNHAWDEGKVTTEATCTTEGYLVKTCQNGCGEDKTEVIPATGHDYKSVVTAPTCEEQGYTTYSCYCGDTYVEDYVAATGHAMDEGKVTTEATCTTAGVLTKTCKNGCGKTTTEVIPATGHDHKATVVAPTCEEQGYTTHTCHCGDTYTDTHVDPLGHDFGDWEKIENSESEDGNHVRSCKRCGKEETDPHNFTTVETKPTCTEKGYITYTCGCGYVKVDNYVAATGHDMDEGKVTTEPTCVTEGVLTKTCKNGCGETATEAIPATGHTYESVVTKPTCTEQGYTTHTCHCGDTYVDDYVVATGHAMDEGKVTTEATCTTAGVLTKTCQNGCGETTTEVIPATGHTYESVVTKPTCTEQGYTTHTCHCGDTYVDDYVAATGHAWDEGEVTTEATCTTAGVLTKTCENGCGETTTEVIPATGHDHKATVTSPTCTEQGYTTYTCHCGDTYIDDYVDATGHSYSKTVTAPTCTEGGYTTYNCHCGHKYVGDETEALGHVGGEATCTARPVCSVCGTEYGEALGHEMVPATCTAAAYCENCDYTEGEALGHIGGTATCTALAICERCGKEHGTLAKHEMADATCTDAAHCANCDYTEGKSLGHTGGTATCTALAVCSRCGDDYGSLLPHEYTEKSTDERYLTASATCTDAAVYAYSCVCGEKGSETFTHGEALGHSYDSWKSNGDGAHTHTCARCDDVETEKCSGGKASCTLAAVCDICKEYYGEALGHSYDEGTVSTPATCTTAGVKTFTCSCGATTTEAIPATGHNYESKVTAPTCTAKGYTTHTCQNEGCQHSYVDSYVDANGHSFGEWTTEKAATCTATGLEVRVCGTCEHSETNILAALGHDYAHVVTAPTCTTKGYTTHTCQRTDCGDFYVDTYVKEAAHNLAEKVTAPTCTAKGFTTYTCTNEKCGYYYDGNYTDAIDHSYGDWFVEKAATCTAAGVERRDCNNCDHFETKVIDAQGHDYGAAVKAPTCTAKGYTTYTCKTEGCGHTYVSDYVDAQGHDYDTVVTAPTCTAKGYTTYTCKTEGCGDTYVSDYTNETGHDCDAVVTAPTCVAKGYTTYTCTNSGCQHTYVADFKDANGHSWNITAPTCEEDQVCSVCGETNEATGHDIYLASTTPASCTAAAVNNYLCHNCEESRQESVGTPTEHNVANVIPELILKDGETCVYTEHYTCADCGADVVGKEVVTHEKYTASITKAATCVETGIKTLTCPACGETKEEIIKADAELGHAWDEGVLVGTTRTFTCQHDGCEATKSVYDASGKTTANVSSEDLKNEVALKDANLNFGDAGVNQDVTIGADTLTDEDKKNLEISDEALEQVGDNPIYNFTMTSGDTTIAEFDGYVVITIPYVLSEGEDVDSIAIWYIEGEELVAIPATYNNGYVTFKTNHFSYYTVTKLTPKQRCALYGHNYSYMTVDPTCTEQGYVLMNCIRCNHTEKDKDTFVAPIDHKYTVKETAASCTEAGVRTYTCGACSHSYTEEIDPLGHKYNGVVTAPATCTTAGTMTYTCACGAEKTEAIPSLGHNYSSSVVTDPTCTEKGYTTYTCTNNGCAHTYVDNYKDAKGHSFDAWYVYTEPTCIMHGVERRDCSGCDHFETRLINAKGHDYSETVTAPTCIEQGYTTFVCKNEGCRDNYVGAFVPAKGHDHKAVVTAPTCISKGYTTYTCACGNTYVADYTATIDHSYDTVVTAPTCISKGYTTYTCKIEGCSHTYKADFTNASDHSYGEWKEIVAVTCTEDGLNRRDCENCDHFENEVVKALGHNYNTVVTAPTCTEQGYTTYSCENDGCGHVYTSDYVPAKGHSYESVVTEPTCDEAGYTTHTCDCGDVYTDNYTSPVGHDYEAEWEWDDDFRHAWVNVRCKHGKCHHHGNPHRERIDADVRGFDSTCDKNGRDEYHVHFEFGGKSFSDKRETQREKNNHNYHEEYQWNKEHHWYKCSGCSGNSGKISHEFDEGTVTRTPNCIRDGEITYKCVCGYTKTEILSKTESHTASREVYHNAEAHWNVCIHCGEVCNVNVHQWDEGRVTTSANCTEEGIMTYRCSCTETKTEVIPTNNSHSYKDDLAYDETSHWGECVRCGNDTDVVAHEFGDWKTIKAPSCTEEGVRQHKCACGYAETEAVPVAEHTYIANTSDDEHWNECRVCGEKSDVAAHVHEFEIKFALPSCISEGIRITACSCGHWNVEVLPPNDIHDYSVPAFDENGHWMECKLCGHKSEAEEHNYSEESAVVTKVPTCIHEGYADVKCDCGHKTTITLEPTGIHEYVDGSCKHCGAEEIKCDHTELHNVVLDMAELGFCGGYITYNTCDCGEVVEMAGDLAITCENVVYGEEKEGIDENGNAYVTASLDCLDCGIHVELYATVVEDGCVTAVTYEYTFADGTGKVFLVAYQGWENEYHENREETTIGIADKTCGTDFKVLVCTDCGEVLDFLGGVNISCDIIQSEPEDEYDENGEFVSVTVREHCSKCGLAIVARAGINYIDECNYEQYEIIEIYVGETLEFEYSSVSSFTDHNYETTYEKLGESCEDGIKVTTTCTKCGDTHMYEQYSHVTRYEEFNTSDFGMCEGLGNKETCQVCNEVTYVSVHYTNCWYEHVSTDETGLEIWRCNNCGVERHSATIRSEKDENCDLMETIVDKYYINGELVLDATHTRPMVVHNMQYTYELHGEDCEDGYTIYEVCLDCGWTWDYVSEGHRYVEEVTDLGELGLCPGTIFRSYCTICDKTENRVESSCNWVDVHDVTLPTDTPVTFLIRQAYTAKVLYLDGGVTSGRYLSMTEDPAAAISIYAEKSGNGYSFYHIVDGQKMYINVGYNEAGKMAVYYSADSASVLTYRFDVNAWTTAVDGIEYYIGTYSSYNTVSACSISYISSGNTGVSQFPVEIEELVVSEENKTICSICGAEKRTSMEEVWTGSCTYQCVYTHEYYLNGTLVCTGVERMDYSQHNNTVDYILSGESCDNGYEIVYTCITCGSEYRTYGNGHINETEAVDLSVYGITCGGTHYKNTCTICHNVTKEWVEEACDWHMAGVTMGEEATAPAENTAYAAYMDQRIAGARVYLDGGTTTRFLTTTTDPAKAVSVYAEAHEGGYAFYILLDGVKMYITIGYGYSEDGNLGISYDAYNMSIYTYRADIGAWVTTTETGIECFIGAYDAFTTVSPARVKYINADNTGVNEFPIKFAEMSISEDGAHETCSVCGTEKRYSEELIQNGCDFTRVNTVSYVISGQTVLSVSDYTYYSEHHYNPTFTMYGTSCEDGYDVTYTCKDCGDSFVQYFTTHEIFKVYEADFANSNSCKHHFAYFEACPCGAAIGDIHFDVENLVGMEPEGDETYAKHGYICEDCGFSIVVTYSVAINGCIYTETVNLDVIIDGAVDYNYNMSYDYERHDVKVTYTENEDGSFIVKKACSVCGEGTVTESQVVTITYNAELGYSSYDLYFTPEHNGVYYLYSVCNTDTDAILYEVLEDGTLSQLTDSDNRYSWKNFGIKKTLKAGTTYVYRIYSTSTTSNVVVPYVLTEVDKSFDPKHATFAYYEATPENYIPCKDAIYAVYLCDCGCGYVGHVERFDVRGDHEYNEEGVCVNCGEPCPHNIHELKYFDLADYGFCGGIIMYYTCECGEYCFYDVNEQVQEIMCENTVITDDGGENEDGTVWQKQTIECPDCGMYAVFDLTATQCGHVTGDMTFYTRKGGEVLKALAVEINQQQHQETELVGIGLGDKVCGGDIFMNVCTACGEVLFDGDFSSGKHSAYEAVGSYSEDLDDKLIFNLGPGNVECFVRTWAGFPASYDVARTAQWLIDNYGAYMVLEDGTNYFTAEAAVAMEGKNLAEIKADPALAKAWESAAQFGVALTGDPIVWCTIDEGDSQMGLTCANLVYSKEENYLNNGVEVVSTISCADCGIYIVTKQYQHTENCITTSGTLVEVYTNGVLFYTWENSETTHNHNFELGYEYDGTPCEDGYNRTIRCYGCGFELAMRDHEHPSTYEEYINLTELGFCGGDGYKNICNRCGEVTNIRMYLWACNFVTVSYDEATGLVVEKCTICGAEKHYSETRSEKDENCNFTVTIVEIYYMNGELVFDNSHSYISEEHNYETTYEFEGEDCEDGYKVIEKCIDCGYVQEYYNEGHSTYYEEIDWVTLGIACGGYGSKEICQVCDRQIYFNCGTHCNYIETGVDEATGATIYTCQNSNCGSVMKVYVRRETINSCSYYVYSTEEYYANDTLILSVENTGIFEAHQWVYEYIFDDESNRDCSAGVTVNYYCTVCGVNNSDYITYHNIYEMYRADFVALGCCTDKHSFYYGVCPCGYHYSYDWSSGLDYDGEAGIYYCTECAYTVSDVSGEETDGCIIYSVNTVTMYVDGTEIHSFRISAARVEHDFDITASIAEDGTYIISMVCESCGFTVNPDAYDDYRTDGDPDCKSHSYIYVNVLPEGLTSCEEGALRIRMCYCGMVRSVTTRTSHTKYDKETIDISELGGCDTVFRIRSCACGESVSVSYDNYNCSFGNYEYSYYVDDNGIEHTVETGVCVNCGFTRETDYYNSLEGCIEYRYYTYSFSMAGNKIVSYEEKSHYTDHHEYSYSYEFVDPSNPNCEAGVNITTTCSACGQTSSRTYTYHSGFISHRYDFTDYGADGGYVVTQECPCGEYKNFSVSNCPHGWNYNTNEYTDEEGIRWYVETHWTEGCDCDIRYDRKYYYTYDEENCTRLAHITYSVSVGDTLVAQMYRESTEDWHDVITEVILNGETCDEGGTIIYTCSRCDYRSEGGFSGHYTVEKERIYLEEYGSVCGGYVSIEECACGYIFEWSVERAECHFDHKWTNDFVEGDIDSYQYTADGYNSFYTNSYIYTCAVTHPEQCGFAIRYSTYWMKNDDCSATRYLTMQFGYDEESGTYTGERTITLESRTYHNYEYTSINNGEKHECPDCGSYYSHTYEYSENGHQTKSSEIYVNTLDDGCNKYREYTYEYLGESLEHIGNPQTLAYYKYIYADGREWWEMNEYTHTVLDETPYGDFAWTELCISTNSNGYWQKSEHRIFSYKGYSFIFYNHREESDGSWYKYDYAYDFTDGCMRTETYTDSNGQNTTYNPQSAHPTWWHKTIKEPTCTQPGIQANWCPVCEHSWNESYTNPTEHNWVMLNNGIYYCYDCGLQNINGATGDIVMEDLTREYGNGEAYVIGYYLKSNHQFTPFVLITLHEPVLIDGEENYVLILELTEEQIHFVEDEYVGIYVTLADIEAAVAEINKANDLALTSDMYDVTITLVPDGADSLFDYAITFADLEGADEIDYVIKTTEFFVEYVAEGETVEFTICPETSGYWDIEVISNYGSDFYIYDSNGDVMHGSGAGHHITQPYFNAGETYTVRFTMHSTTWECYVAFSFTQVVSE